MDQLGRAAPVLLGEEWAHPDGELDDDAVRVVGIERDGLVVIHHRASVAVLEQSVSQLLEGIEVGDPERDVVRPTRRPSPVDRSVRNSPSKWSCGSSTASSDSIAGVEERVAGPTAAGQLEHVDLGQGEADRFGVEAMGGLQVLGRDCHMVKRHGTSGSANLRAVDSL